ncbi:MAG: hypothetical protein RLZZ58_2177 [Pseudomonadota bacterium]
MGRRARAPRNAAGETLWSASMLAAGVALVAPGSGWAQDAAATATSAPDATPAPDTPATKPGGDDRQIIVIGDRAIIATLKNIEPEQSYDAQRVASYAVSTVGELLDQVRAENGDDAPSILINGQPVNDLGDIADFPVEVIERIDALPRGTATKVGGPPGQRAYNVVLKPAVRSMTLTGSREMASADGWGNNKGEVLLTWIKGQDRINLTLRAARSDPLFESDRAIIPLAEFTPFAAAGNIIPQFGTEIDPLLSALAGRPVGTVALAGGNSRPTLTDMLAGADKLNPSNASQYRSLRGTAEPYDISIAGNKRLAPWLTLSFNGRLGWTENVSQSGLPSARFNIAAANAFTPFSQNVLLALNDPARPLRSVSTSTSGSLSTTLNANFGAWRLTTAARLDERNRRSASDRVGSIGGGSIAIDNGTNPFAAGLAALIPVTQRLSRTDTFTRQITHDAEGPLLTLPTGDLRLRAGLWVVWAGLDGIDANGTARRFRRRETTTKAGVTIPLFGGEASWLAGLGDADFSFDIGRTDLGRHGRLDRHTLGIDWNPLAWLRLSAGKAKDSRAIAPELIASPTTVTENVRYFDPLTGDTVDLTTISGGAANLRPEQQRTTTLSVTASPLSAYNLQLNAIYLVTNIIDQIGALPPPSSAVVAAFPDRFVRDTNGRLVLVDQRTVNFARQHSRELRGSVGFGIPLSAAPPPLAPRKPGDTSPRPAPPPRTMLQVQAAHTVLLEARTVIRDGLPPVDLLNGGAIGIGGGRQRNVTDASVTLTQGGTGLRVGYARRGPSSLVTGTLTAPDMLTFGAVAQVDVKAFVDLGALFDGSKLAKGGRLTMAIDNVTNKRQRVTDLSGATPTSFQPAYLDPVGRTVMFELRKVF